MTGQTSLISVPPLGKPGSFTQWSCEHGCSHGGRVDTSPDSKPCYKCQHVLTALLRHDSPTIQFTHLKCDFGFHWFLVDSQSVFPVPTSNCRTLHHSQRELRTPWLSPSFLPSLPSPCKPRMYFPVSVDLSVLDISYEWNHVMLCIWLASFTQLSVLKTQPCRSMNLNVIPFYGWIRCQGMDLPRFIFPLISSWAFGLLLLFWLARKMLL